MKQFLCFAFLLPALSCLPVENHVADGYQPRAINPNEEFVTEIPPQNLPSFASNIKPVEFQYFVPSVPQDTSSSQQYYNYQVIPNTDTEQDYVNDNGEGDVEGGLARNLRPPPESAVPTSYRAYLDDTIIRQYFGSKSKYNFDKDQVGSPGKENRFKRNADGGSSSYSQSSSSASSSLNGQPTQFFSNQQGFQNYNPGFDLSGFNSYNDGYQSQGFDQSGFYGNNAGYDNGDFRGTNLVSRFGSSDVDGPSIGASGSVNNVKGVSASSSASIDSNGRATYSVESKKFG